MELRYYISQGDLSIDPCCGCISFELHFTFPNQLYSDIKFMIKAEKPKSLMFIGLNKILDDKIVQQQIFPINRVISIFFVSWKNKSGFSTCYSVKFKARKVSCMPSIRNTFSNISLSVPSFSSTLTVVYLILEKKKRNLFYHHQCSNIINVVQITSLTKTRQKCQRKLFLFIVNMENSHIAKNNL